MSVLYPRLIYTAGEIYPTCKFLSQCQGWRFIETRSICDDAIKTQFCLDAHRDRWCVRVSGCIIDDGNYIERKCLSDVLREKYALEEREEEKLRREENRRWQLCLQYHAQFGSRYLQHSRKRSQQFSAGNWPSLLFTAGRFIHTNYFLMSHLEGSVDLFLFHISRLQITDV